MVQLIGYWSWDHAGDGQIDEDDVLASLDRCERELNEALTSFPGTALPRAEQQYVEVMARHDGPTSTGVIARELGKSAQHANVLRTRLLERGLIRAVSNGQVDFSIPGHRARLRIRSLRRHDES
jgi:hypothetical protein